MTRDLRKEADAYVNKHLSALSPEVVDLLNLRRLEAQMFVEMQFRLQFIRQVIDDFGAAPVRGNHK